MQLTMPEVQGSVGGDEQKEGSEISSWDNDTDSEKPVNSEV